VQWFCKDARGDRFAASPTLMDPASAAAAEAAEAKQKLKEAAEASDGR
jgi:hypothetical protein